MVGEMLHFKDDWFLEIKEYCRFYLVHEIELNSAVFDVKAVEQGLYFVAERAVGLGKHEHLKIR